MRVYIVYKNERTPVDISIGKTVAQAKKIIENQVYFDDYSGSESSKLLTLSYAGGELQDKWIFTDVILSPGSSIKVSLVDREYPLLIVYCGFQERYVDVFGDGDVEEMTVAELRRHVSRTVGIPVGTFYLTPQHTGEELFDCKTGGTYGIEKGDTLVLKTWLGWDDFLRYAVLGFTTGVVSEVEETFDEKVAHYQKKVVMMIAAHFGHDDLAEWAVSEGMPTHEWIGEHPYREWCKNSQHPDSKTTPIHEAARFGRLAVLRRFVLVNAFAVTARDGEGLLPLSIALRNKQKPCAGFLLARSWARVEIENITVPISLCAKIKLWAYRAKVKVWAKFGPTKSSLKKKPYINVGVLVGNVGVQIDGFPKSDSLRKTREISYKLDDDTVDDPDAYFRIVAGAPSLKLPKVKDRLYRTELRRVKIQEPGSRQTSALRLLGRQSSQRPSSGGHDSAERKHLPLGNSQTQQDQDQDLTRSESLENYFPSSKRNTFDSKMTFFQTGAMASVDDAIREVEEPPDPPKPKVNLKRLARKANTIAAPIPLPEISLENRLRPFFHARNKSEDPKTTLKLYEKYRGMKARDYAIQSLSIASTFKDKPWLKQVRMAMTFVEFGVKRAGCLRGNNK